MSHPSDETVTPRNCGLLARDLTEAAFKAGSRGKERYDSYYSDSYPEIQAAERAITDRILGLESENKKLKARLQRIADWYAAMGAGFQKLGEQESLR